MEAGKKIIHRHGEVSVYGVSMLAYARAHTTRTDIEDCKLDIVEIYFCVESKDDFLCATVGAIICGTGLLIALIGEDIPGVVDKIDEIVDALCFGCAAYNAAKIAYRR